MEFFDASFERALIALYDMPSSLSAEDGPRVVRDEPITRHPDAEGFTPLQAALVRYLRANPGATTADAAKDASEPVNHVNTRLTRLRRQGRVRSVGQRGRPCRWYVNEALS